MARLQFSVGLPCISVDVIVPEYTFRNPGDGMTQAEYYSNRSLPVLFLLHGAFGNSSDWLRMSRIEDYANRRGIVVVCPSAENSFYTNWPNGGVQWADAIFVHLWAYMQRMLPISDKREDCFVAGLSMGGYGALKFALTFPERFAAVGAFSSAVGIPTYYAEKGEHDIVTVGHIFGDRDKVIGSDYDLYSVAHRVGESSVIKPKIYLSCGTQDSLYDDNIKMRDTMRESGFEVEWDEGPYGHEWPFWDLQVGKFLSKY